MVPRGPVFDPEALFEPEPQSRRQTRKAIGQEKGNENRNRRAKISRKHK
jgi:hypothetical protein